MKKIFVTIVFIFISMNIMADEPPVWRSFEIFSRNENFIAKVEPVDKASRLNQWEQNYQLSVYEKENSKILWSCDYKYDGYPEGILSNDGSTFIYINEWYYKGFPAILIYQNGELKKQINGKDLMLDLSKLITTTSHQLWLNADVNKRDSLIEDEDFFGLKINTIDRQRIFINLRTFEIKRITEMDGRTDK